MYFACPVAPEDGTGVPFCGYIMFEQNSKIVFNKRLAPEIFLLALESPKVVAEARPGQFVMIRVTPGIDPLLRRPFSICGTRGDDLFLILYKVVGRGTAIMSQTRAGEKLSVLGPLGTGFDLPKRDCNSVLVAGGIGVAPLIFLAQRTLPKHSVTIVHGASTASLIYPLSSIFINSSTERDRKDSSSILNSRFHYITVTDDGSSGHKGVATDVVVDHLNWADQVFACGPTNMYVTMSVLCKNMQIAKSVNEPVELHEDNKTKLQRCQISLEMVMGCGIGSCYGCSVNTKDGMRTVCRDGPVFELCQVLWNKILI